MLARLQSLWRAVRHRSRFEREMDDELRFHLDERIAHHVREGAGPEEAARRARLEFGNTEAWQDVCRESRGLGIIDGLRADLQFAWRSMRKHAMLSATIVATLALGIGANTAMFSVLHLVLVPASYSDSDRLVIVNCRVTLPDGPRTFGWSYPKFDEIRRLTTTFESMAAFAGLDVNLTHPGEPERLYTEIVSAEYFSTLRIRPRLGSLNLPDGVPAPAHVVLSESLWRRRFDGDPNVVGTAIELNGAPFTVVGVAPVVFRGETGRAEAWVSLAATPMVSPNPKRLQLRMAHWLSVVARLNRGVAVKRADEDLKLAVQRMEEQQPSGEKRSTGGTGWDGTVVPLLDAKIDPAVRNAVSVLGAAVGCVLLVTCLNLASVLLGRAVARRREIAIRLALGASRARIVRQFLTESLLLAAIGGAAGFVVAAGGLDLLTRLGFEVPAYPGAPFVRSVDLAMVRIDQPIVIVYGLAIAVVAGLLFGIVPALQGSRPDVADALKGSRGGWLAGRRRAGAPTLRRGLLIAQVALAVVLLSGAGLMIRTFARLLSTRIGVETDGVLTLRVDLPASQYTAGRAAQFLHELSADLRTLPGVETVAVTNALPLQGQTERTMATIEGVPLSEETGVHTIGADYFQVLRIPLIRGRLVTDADSSTHVALLSESAARRYMPYGDPIGRRLSLGLVGWDGAGTAEIVGIVGDVKYQLLTMPFASDVYLSYTQRAPLRAYFVVRATGDLATLVSAIRSRVTRFDRALPVYAVRTMNTIVASATAGQRFTSFLLALFSAMALVVACVGVYGTLAYSVTARTREFGVRMALGARRTEIVRLVGREVLIIGVAGVVVGLAGARAAGRLVAGLLYQVQPTDPPTFIVVSLLLLTAAGLAGLVPALRASQISPTTALREE